MSILNTRTTRRTTRNSTSSAVICSASLRPALMASTTTSPQNGTMDSKSIQFMKPIAKAFQLGVVRARPRTSAEKTTPMANSSQNSRAFPLRPSTLSPLLPSA